MKSITFFRAKKGSDVCTCIIQNLQDGKNKSVFNVPLSSVACIVECNLED